MTYQVRPLDRPAIYCFFGGRFAAALEREGEAAMFAFAAGELARLFGNDIRKQMAPLASTAWLQRPLGARLLLLRAARPRRRPRGARRPGRRPPVLRRRGHSPNFFSTAHGAWLSGIAAADAALASLRAAAATR